MQKNEIGYRALKELGSKAIQDAIEKAICELTGEEYQVDVNRVEFDNDTGSWMHDEVIVTFSTRRKLGPYERELAVIEDSVPANA